MSVWALVRLNVGWYSANEHNVLGTVDQRNDVLCVRAKVLIWQK